MALSVSYVTWKATAAIILLIYLPLSIYGTYIYTKYRNHVVIQKRHPQITIAYNIVLMVVLIGYGISCIEWIWWTAHPVTAGFAIVAGLLTIRSYLNYFDVKYATAIISSEWKSVICPTSPQINWFLNNKHRFGSLSFWRIPLIIYSLLNVVGVYSVEFLFPDDEHMKIMAMNAVCILSCLPCVCAMTVIRCKTIKFHDVFHQRGEMIRIIRPSLLAILYTVIATVVRDFWQNEEMKDMADISVFFVCSTVATWIIYTTTIGVMVSNKKWFWMIDGEIDVFHITWDKPAVVANSTVQQRRRFIRMDDVLTTNNGFEAFMFHLAQEFSSENLLSLVEMTQFQQSLMQYYNYHDETFLDKKNWIKTPPSIPQSAIVFPVAERKKTKSPSPGPPMQLNYLTSASTVTSTASAEITVSAGTDDEVEMTASDDHLEPLEMDKVQEFVKKAQGIYMKYIDIGSPFQVNVSWQTRKSVTEKLRALEFVNGGHLDEESLKITVRQIYTLFAPTMRELHGLLSSTFTRFKSTALFEKVMADNGGRLSIPVEKEKHNTS